MSELIAAHEAGHAVACVAQGIKVNVIWVKGVNAAADVNIRTFKLDDGVNFDVNDGLCGNDCDENTDPRKHLIVDVAGEAAEQLHQGLPADLWYESSRSTGDIDMAVESAESILTQRGEDATDEAIKDVIEDAYRDSFALLTKHRDAHRRVTDLLMERGILTYAEVVTVARGNAAATGK
jgi:hypothetical protein